MSSGEQNFDYEYVATRTMMIFFKLMGLAPFSIRRSPQWKHTKREALQDSVSIKLSSSHFGCAYNLALITVQIIMLVIAIPVVHDTVYPNASLVTRTIDTASCIFGNGLMLVIWLTSGLRQKTSARLINRLLTMDRATDLFNVSHLPDSSSSFILLISLTNNALWAGKIWSSRVAYNFPILRYFEFTISSYIFTWFVFQYTFVVKLIENRFKAVNRALLDRTIPSESHIPHGLLFNQSSSTKIATLKRAYTSLCDISEEISSFYSVLILLTIADMSFMFLYNSYYLIVPFVTAAELPYGAGLVNTLIWFFTQSLPIVMLTSGVTNVVKESRKTGDIVWNLLTMTNIRRDDNDQLEQFSLELLHRKVEFSACGFFSLDLTIVHSIIGMVFTYLAILIQFQMGSSTKASKKE